MGKNRLYKRGVVIDDRKRIVLPSELLEEFKLKIGNKICVYADFDNSKIVIKRDNRK